MTCTSIGNVGHASDKGAAIGGDVGGREAGFDRTHSTAGEQDPTAGNRDPAIDPTP